MDLLVWYSSNNATNFLSTERAVLHHPGFRVTPIEVSCRNMILSNSSGGEGAQYLYCLDCPVLTHWNRRVTWPFRPVISWLDSSCSSVEAHARVITYAWVLHVVCLALVFRMLPDRMVAATPSDYKKKTMPFLLKKSCFFSCVWKFRMWQRLFAAVVVDAISMYKCICIHAVVNILTLEFLVTWEWVLILAGWGPCLIQPEIHQSRK